VDNCQGGVFLSYSTPTESTLIDRLLYLPQKWISNPERCKNAGIPPQARRFRTKAQLRLEMILQAKLIEAGVLGYREERRLTLGGAKV
jgi:SRSO17 transposase